MLEMVMNLLKMIEVKYNHELTEPINLLDLLNQKRNCRANHYHPQQEQNVYLQKDK